MNKELLCYIHVTRCKEEDLKTLRGIVKKSGAYSNALFFNEYGIPGTTKWRLGFDRTIHYFFQLDTVDKDVIKSFRSLFAKYKKETHRVILGKIGYTPNKSGKTIEKTKNIIVCRGNLWTLDLDSYIADFAMMLTFFMPTKPLQREFSICAWPVPILAAPERKEILIEKNVIIDTYWRALCKIFTMHMLYFPYVVLHILFIFMCYYCSLHLVTKFYLVIRVFKGKGLLQQVFMALYYSIFFYLTYLLYKKASVKLRWIEENRKESWMCLSKKRPVPRHWLRVLIMLTPFWVLQFICKVILFDYPSVLMMALKVKTGLFKASRQLKKKRYKMKKKM